MAPLALLLKERGFEVSGSDANPFPPMSDLLAKAGVPIKIGFSPSHLEPPPDLVIVGNAVSKNNPEVETLLAKKIPYLSMPQALERFFLVDRVPIVVAGTHGKTTTSGLLAWLLESAGRRPGFLVGGVLRNLERSAQVGFPPYFVLEGDEYDTAFFDKGPKFLHYHPKFLVLNPIEFDHADIYHNLDEVMTSFRRLAETMPTDGFTALHAGSENVQRLIPSLKGEWVTFGLSTKADVTADRIRWGEASRFRLIERGKPVAELATPLWGEHNLENLLGVIAILRRIGLTPDEIQRGLAGFQGMKRRQEILGTWNGITLVDDFAHHPTAIHETLKGLRGRFPGRRLWALFEPRSNTTRRNIFQQEFTACFEAADCVVLAPVYQPEKIPEPERLDPGKIARQLEQAGKRALAASTIDEIVPFVLEETRPGDLVCLMSNGNFGGLGQRLASRWKDPS